jgi:hypothetical protein
VQMRAAPLHYLWRLQRASLGTQGLACAPGVIIRAKKHRDCSRNDDFTVLNAPPDIMRLMCRVIITWFCQLTGEEIDGVFFGVANSKDGDGWLAAEASLKLNS